MKIWGVYKVEQIGDIDNIEGETLIVCFEKEQDALDYKAKHGQPDMLNGEDAYLIVQPITFVPAGEYDQTNNYGLANDKFGVSFKCACGHHGKFDFNIFLYLINTDWI